MFSSPTHKRPEDVLSPRPMLLAVRWTAYGLVLTAGVLLLGVVPHDLPVAPLPAHQHAALTARAPAKVWWAPTLRQLSTSQASSPRHATHQHGTLADESGHDVHIRLSPRQLSLAKW